ncbi:hypothetical protein AN1V17_17560 [Vallitalea sediminicola]
MNGKNSYSRLIIQYVNIIKKQVNNYKDSPPKIMLEFYYLRYSRRNFYGQNAI